MKRIHHFTVMAIVVCASVALSVAPVTAAPKSPSISVRYDTSGLGGSVESYDVPLVVSPPACVAAFQAVRAEFSISMDSKDPSAVQIVPKFTLTLRQAATGNAPLPSLRVVRADPSNRLHDIDLEAVEVTRKDGEVSLTVYSGDLTSPKFLRSVELRCR